MPLTSSSSSSSVTLSSISSISSMYPDDYIIARKKVDNLLRIVVALNNLGIQMLSNDCYYNSCETITDSLSVLGKLASYCHSLNDSIIYTAVPEVESISVPELEQQPEQEPEQEPEDQQQLMAATTTATEDEMEIEAEDDNDVEKDDDEDDDDYDDDAIEIFPIDGTTTTTSTTMFHILAISDEIENESITLYHNAIHRLANPTVQSKTKVGIIDIATWCSDITTCCRSSSVSLVSLSSSESESESLSESLDTSPSISFVSETVVTTPNDDNDEHQQHQSHPIPILVPICIHDIDFAWQCLSNGSSSNFIHQSSSSNFIGGDYHIIDEIQKKKYYIQEIMYTIDRFNFESAIILQNLALVQFCISLSVKHATSNNTNNTNNNNNYIQPIQNQPQQFSTTTTTASFVPTTTTTTTTTIATSRPGRIYRYKAATIYSLSKTISSSRHYVAFVQHVEILDCTIHNLTKLYNEFIYHNEIDTVEARSIVQTIQHIQQTKSNINRIALSFTCQVASAA